MNNNKTSSSSSSSRIGFCGLLTVAFIVLRLLGVITWHWIWIVAPLWVPAVLWIMFIILWLIALNH